VAALAPHPRDEFLEAMAREVGALKCPGVRYTIGADAIVFEEA
jgi:hypothetical protein